MNDIDRLEKRLYNLNLAISTKTSPFLSDKYLVKAKREKQFVEQQLSKLGK